jgi:hypothetical protein
VLKEQNKIDFVDLKHLLLDHLLEFRSLKIKEEGAYLNFSFRIRSMDQEPLQESHGVEQNLSLKEHVDDTLFDLVADTQYADCKLIIFQM